jgi:dihydrofolate reductase
MTLKVSVFIATSLDGFIAREDGSLDWLDKANETVPKGEDCGYVAFMESVDVLVMGRNSYEKVRSFGFWPYEKPVIVLSSQNLEIPDELKAKVEHSSESPKEVYERLSKQGFKKAYIDGGYTIRQFIKAGLVDDMIITKIPMIIGKGISLFGGLEKDINLKQISGKVYDFGFTQLKYEIVKK